MTASHLIAVNCHEFHKPADISRGLSSVADAVDYFRGQTGDPIHVRVYWHNSDGPKARLRDQIAASGFELVCAPHHSNGENLNRQVDDARRDGFDIFFRVDADDTVTLRRFVLQSELLTAGACDLCGGGLHYIPPDAPGYLMLPEVRPGPVDFIENQFVLHPSMAFRLDAFDRAGLRYWPHRLEDKALLLQARKAGLRIRNLGTVVGTYNLDPRSRNLFRQKWLNLKLNLEFLLHSGSLRHVPYAVFLFSLHVALGSNRLRRIRYLMRRRKAPHSPQSAAPRKRAKPVIS